MDNTALVISTHDRSEDLWRPLEMTYKKFWSNIKYPIYLTTNIKSYNSDLFHSLKIGDEVSWSDNLIKSLNKIDNKYIILTFDDLFLTGEVNNYQIDELVDYAIKNDFNYLQFYRSISRGRRINSKLFKKNLSTVYRNSTIWSFWKKEILIDLLERKEDAWQFETIGNRRSSKYADFYSTRSNIIPFKNGVIKGRWDPLVKNKLKNMNIECSESRANLTFLETVNHRFLDLQFDILTSIIHFLY